MLYINIKIKARMLTFHYHTQLSWKKGTKTVTGAVPFQKVHFCTY